MEQLRTLDAGFLLAEDSDRHLSLASGAIAIIEGGAPDHGQIRSLLAEGLRAIPRSKQLLRNQPFDLGSPKWIDKPGFDLNHHVRRLTLRRPGGDAELFGGVAGVLQRRLDRDRPLWECWVVDGLSGDRWAMLLKVHRCIADGASATRILSRLCERPDGDTFGSSMHPRRAATARVHLRPVPDLPPKSPADDLWRVAAALTGSAARTVRGAADVAVGLMRPATGSPPAGSGCTKRCYRAVRVPLADVERVCRKFDVSVDDVARAAITEGLRSVSLHRGESPHRDSPSTELPIGERDPVQQLRIVHVRLRRAEHGGSTVVPGADRLPFLLSAKLVRLVTRLPQRSIATLAPNVSGPVSRLELLNRNVVEVLPIPALELRMRTGVAVLSYGENLVFGLTADADAASGVELLANGITRAVRRLVALSGDCVLLFAR